MEQVNAVELADEAVYPDDSVLSAVLGDSFSAYTQALELFDRLALVPEWRYYRDGKAWLCKVQYKKKTIVWMSAWKGFMKATVYVPERLEEELYKLPISSIQMAAIRSAQKVGRSKPCMIDIHDESVLTDLEILINFKVTVK